MYVYMICRVIIKLSHESTGVTEGVRSPTARTKFALKISRTPKYFGCIYNCLNYKLLIYNTLEDVLGEEVEIEVIWCN